MAQPFTVGQLIERGLTAFWKCQACAAAGELDLPRVARERGPGVVLMNRSPPCRRCAAGRVFFYVRGGLAVARQTTAAADRRALAEAAAAIARDLEARGFRRVAGRWVPPAA